MVTPGEPVTPDHRRTRAGEVVVEVVVEVDGANAELSHERTVPSWPCPSRATDNVSGGTVAERTNASALKAEGCKARGFESLPFRQGIPWTSTEVRRRSPKYELRC